MLLAASAIQSLYGYHEVLLHESGNQIWQLLTALELEQSSWKGQTGKGQPAPLGFNAKGDYQTSS